MGDGTIFEKGGQKRVRRGSANFFYTLPPLLLNLPTLDIVFWVGKSPLHRCPPKSLKVKRELFIYHNTALFLHKIQGGQSSLKLFTKREIQGGQCPS